MPLNALATETPTVHWQCVTLPPTPANISDTTKHVLSEFEGEALNPALNEQLALAVSQLRTKTMVWAPNLFRIETSPVHAATKPDKIDELANRIAWVLEPYVPKAVGLAESGAIMGGLTKTRVHQLVRSGEMPEPVQRLRATPLWLTRDVVRLQLVRLAHGGIKQQS